MTGYVGMYASTLDLMVALKISSSGEVIWSRFVG